jgi:phosphatidylethanolamine-binding protein (PEBP) family uncharacterized protein
MLRDPAPPSPGAPNGACNPERRSHSWHSLSRALRAAAGKTLKNSFGRTGYGGPCLPPGHGSHRYFFTVYAVDVLALEVPGDKREDLEAALKGHTLGKAGFMGRYERTR